MRRRRYLIVLLLFCIVFVAYMDRVNFAVSIPAIQNEFGFSLEQIGRINFAWAMAYAVFSFPGGWIADRLRLRWGMAASLAWWSVFTSAAPLAGGLGGWLGLRALMGVGEAPVWSYMAQATDDWIPEEERSTAYSLAGSGEFLGPAAGALVAGFIASTLGWRWCFWLFGAIGLLLLPVWIIVVRDGPERDRRVSRAERARIGEHPAPGGADWAGLRRVAFSRVGAGIMLTYLTNGYVLATFKNWVPSYMHDTFHSSTMGGALWASVSNGLGFVGYLLAGPFNDGLVRRMDRLRARRLGTAIPGVLAMVCLLASILAARAQIVWATALLIGLAQMLCTITAGAWAVSPIDLSPSRGSTGLLYGYFNGTLNLMGAANALAITWLATRFGYPAAFGSAVLMIAAFVAGIVFVVDRPGYERLFAAARRGHAATG